VRFGALLSFVFIVMEGLVGASLVLFEWVAHNASVARAVSTAVHFTNTLFLLTALTLTAWWANGGQRLPWRQQGQRTWLTGLGLLALIILGSSGAINALGDTLFPVGSLREGIQQDFAPTAHFLVQLRIWHPILAIGTSLYLWLMSQYLTADNAPTELKRWTRRLKIILIVQLLVGFSNVLLLAPIWLQIVHLLLADLVLITFVLFAATVLVQAENRVNVHQLASQNGD
jgi:heme A synthase